MTGICPTVLIGSQSGKVKFSKIIKPVSYFPDSCRPCRFYLPTKIVVYGDIALSINTQYKYKYKISKSPRVKWVQACQEYGMIIQKGQN